MEVSIRTSQQLKILIMFSAVVILNRVDLKVDTFHENIVKIF